MTALWPFVLITVMALCLVFCRRIIIEEAIKRGSIVGYKNYLAAHRWRMLSRIW